MIIHDDFPIYYNENALMAISVLKEKFDAVIVLKKILIDYPRGTLIKAVSDLVGETRIILQE